MRKDVTISWFTAVEALRAMKRISRDGGYSQLMADDASGVRQAMAELEEVTKARP